MMFSERKTSAFTWLFQEFVDTYPDTRAGRVHLGAYETARAHLRQHFAEICRAADRGEDVTDDVITRLLPHANTKHNQTRGAWVHPAPTITKDLKEWYTNRGNVQPGDWPHVSRAILQFIRRCVEAPNALRDAVQEFTTSGYARGFQAGFLTPALNALRPDDYLLVNKKPQLVINHYAGTTFGTQLTNYPALNEVGLRLVAELAPRMREAGAPTLHDNDLFDAFCHWMVAEKKYDFSATNALALAPAFASVFANREEADWALDFYREALVLLGATGPDDARFSLSLPGSFGGTLLRLNFGNWAVLDVHGGHRTMHVALLKEEADELGMRPWGSGGPYAHPEAEPAAALYDFPIDEVRRASDPFVSLFQRTFAFIGQRFSHWSASNYRDTHIQAVAEAVFDPALRDRYLPHGLPAPNRPTETLASPLTGGVFTPRTFELLEGLTFDPTLTYYEAHRDDFKQVLEQPFRQLLRDVAARLPADARELLETERKVFGKIPKNDYGKGGAWDFYWGAFYPKGGKRIRDAQLYVRMSHDRLVAGFYVGEYGVDQRKRFVENARLHYHTLVSLLEGKLGGGGLAFGPRSDSAGCPEEGEGARSWKEWLEQAEGDAIRAGTCLTRDQVLQTNREELVAWIASTFEHLYPLVLLATSPEPVDAIRAFVEAPVSDDEPSAPEVETNAEYSIDEVAAKTGFARQELERWVRTIDRKGQGILYGPPGTGKTFLAKELARHLVGGGDGIIDIVQFHPAYTYEDFIQGIRPQGGEDGALTYPTVPGRFLEFCDKAQGKQGCSVLIVDEINRANLSQVFGELMYLLEYRNESVVLAGGKPFRIPEQVRIIGTMNTADRSIALVDHALRRRFAFIALYPNYEILRRYHAGRPVVVDGLIRVLRQLNDQIANRHYELGITFFLREDLDAEIEDIWRMEVEPYLEEYFFDQPRKVAEFRWEAVRPKLYGTS